MSAFVILDMKRDGRTLDHKTLEEMRRMAVHRVWEGEKPSAVIASLGFHRTVMEQIRQFRSDSASFLANSFVSIPQPQHCWPGATERSMGSTNSARSPGSLHGDTIFSII